MRKIKKLHQLTVQWSHARGILTNGKVTTQALKFVSEFGEFSGNLVDQKDTKDDIGDMLVVLTNLSELDGFNLLDVWDKTDNDIEPNFYRWVQIIGDLCDNAGKGNTIKEDIIKILSFLKVITRDFKIGLGDCWEHAYNDIKDRRGFLNAEGNFIKSTDPRYNQLKMEFEQCQK